MSCTDVRRFLDEAPAGALADPPAAERDHLDGCAACAAERELALLAVRALRATGPAPADTATRSRLLGALPPSPPAGRAASAWRRLLAPSPAWAAAALGLVAVAAVMLARVEGWMLPGGEVPADMARVIRDVGHDAFLYTRQRQSFELDTDDPARVTRWFEGRLPFRVEVPPRLGDGRLAGARLWHSVSRLAALVAYRDPEGEEVFLFLVPGDHLADTGGRTAVRDGRTYRVGESFRYRVVAWKDGDVVRALVGRASAESLLDRAAALRGSS